MPNKTIVDFANQTKNYMRSAEVVPSKNLFDFGLLESQVVNGVTITVERDENGNVLYYDLNGTASANTSVYLNDYTLDLFPEGEYVYSDPGAFLELLDNTKGAYTYLPRRKGASGTDNHNVNPASDENKAKQFTVDYSEYDYFAVRLYIFKDTVLDHHKLYPMICTLAEWQKSHTYEPYYVPVKDRISGNNPLATLVENCDDPSVHRNTWGGRYLGSSVTAEQFTQISAGTFHGLLVGDYWTIGGVDWVIADVDYWLHTGDTECTTHHLVIIPRNCLYNAKMNDTDIVTGAYAGSKMRTDNLANAKTTIETAFSSAHILTYRSNLAAGVNNDFENSHPWTDATVELMNESMVFGTERFHNQMQGTSFAEYQTIDKTQLAVFRLNPVFICAKLNNNRTNWWLRDVATSTGFVTVNNGGFGNVRNASVSLSVRPAFGIIG